MKKISILVLIVLVISMFSPVMAKTTLKYQPRTGVNSTIHYYPNSKPTSNNYSSQNTTQKVSVNSGCDCDCNYKRNRYYPYYQCCSKYNRRNINKRGGTSTVFTPFWPIPKPNFGGDNVQPPHQYVGRPFS